MTTESDYSEFKTVENDGISGDVWGVELSLSGPTATVYRSVRCVIMDDEFVQVLLLDGTYESFKTNRIQKILTMRADSQRSSNGPSDCGER